MRVPWYQTLDRTSYDDAREAFDWSFPEGYNAARDCLRKHPDAGAPALLQAHPDGRRRRYSFRDLDVMSNELANHLDDKGITRGDRVAIQVSQKPAALVGHFACWKLGALSVPCSILLGDAGLGYRLRDCGATAIVVDAAYRDSLAAVRGDCPALEHVIEADAGDDATLGTPLQRVHGTASDQRAIADTAADTPATILYTSGTAAEPKGVLHSHGFWVGNCPALQMCFEHGVSDAIGWTPVDWSWNGALGSLIFPLFHYGRPVVGYPSPEFDPEDVFALLAEFDVSHAFIPPTALRLLQDVSVPSKRYDLSLDVIAASGEPLTPDVRTWVEEALHGVVLNELYGLTEASGLVANCQNWFDARAGSAGKVVPGHEVAVLDPETGARLDPGEEGEIAVRIADDPAVFDEYWRDPDATDAARRNGWFLTGDLGTIDSDGYFRFSSRADHLIISSGYRISPHEIEDVLYDHPAVADVGVVGVPDETRGEVVKAFVRADSAPEDPDTLRAELRRRVRDRLAKYKYPREVEFVDAIPQTHRGKVDRERLRKMVDDAE